MVGFAPPVTYSADEVKIWNLLIYNDFHAFCKGDWEMIQNDFAEKEFYAIHSNKSNIKIDWSLKYDSLSVYREDWLRQSKEFLRLDFRLNPLEILFASTKLAKIEIKEDMALVHKEFNGAFELKGADTVLFDWISLFTLRKFDSDWKIIGFVGYLPKH